MLPNVNKIENMHIITSHVSGNGNITGPHVFVCLSFDDLTAELFDLRMGYSQVCTRLTLAIASRRSRTYALNLLLLGVPECKIDYNPPIDFEGIEVYFTFYYWDVYA